MTAQFGGLGTAAGRLAGPTGLATSPLSDPNPRLFVSESGNHRVSVFSPDGSFVHSFGRRGNAEGEFASPGGLAIGPVALDDPGEQSELDEPHDSGLDKKASEEALELYVADTDNHRVQVFGLDGSFKRAWGTQGGGIGEFGFPISIALERVWELDSTGKAVQKLLVFVCDLCNSRVQVFDRLGTFVCVLSNRTHALKPNSEPAAAPPRSPVSTPGPANRSKVSFFSGVTVFPVSGAVLAKNDTEGDKNMQLNVYVSNVCSGELVHFVL